ncbi:UbiA family prenyltransferase, partial [bacterium]|nr:UbiA family prenyltransferase [bacterium]
LIVLICISIGAGAAGALNMWWDRELDNMMERTNSRPLPSEKISSDDAFVFGLSLSIFSIMFLGLVSNWLAASLLALTIFFYLVIYSMFLKKATPQNIVIGGAAGAMPPLIGWVATTGSISSEPLLLFLFIFLWTPPHLLPNFHLYNKFPLMPLIKDIKNFFCLHIHESFPKLPQPQPLQID